MVDGKISDAIFTVKPEEANSRNKKHHMTCASGSEEEKKQRTEGTKQLTSSHTLYEMPAVI